MQKNEPAADPSARGKHGLLNGKYLLVTLAVMAVVLHGSLYPYEFHTPPDSLGPVTALLGSGLSPRDSFGEMIANILLYMPFGFFAMLSLRCRWRFAIVTAVGLALCTAIELAQFYDAGRVTSLSDVCLNTLGTMIGALAVSIVRTPTISISLRKSLTQPVPLILLFAMLGYRLYPYVPAIDLHKYWHTVKPILLHPAIDATDALRYFALWLTASFLISDAVRVRAALLAIGFAIFVLGAKIIIVNQSLSLSEIVGAATAVLLWLAVIRRTRRPAAIVAAVLCAMIVMWRLQPFEFYGIGGPFGWVPFRSLLQGSFGINVQSFCEKAFLYGSLVWVLARAGFDLRVSTAAAAILVLLTSVAETHLPGRSAEITDAVITLIMGVIFIALSGGYVSERRLPSPVTPSHRRFS